MSRLSHSSCWLCLLVLLGLGACGPQPTLIMLDIDSELQIPAEVNALALSVATADDRRELRRLNLRLDEGQGFPLRISLEPSEDTPGTLHVALLGLLDGAEVGQSDASFSWEIGQVTEITMPTLER